MSDKIKINDTHGGSAGSMLDGCYFVPARTIPATYDFYDKDKDNPNNPLATGIKDHSNIAFNLMADPTTPWALHIHYIDDAEAKGEWASGKTGAAMDPGSGSFQAEAGGTIETEDAAASATA